jgi:alpha-1,3-rhamnosyltransferase
LESAKAQTYNNIELIITDDYSTDSTIEICRAWVNEHRQRFVNVEIVTSPQNTGIPANCNRGIKSANGEWVKIIAGDDLLIEDCIHHNISHIVKNTDIKVLFSIKAQYLNNFHEDSFLRYIPRSTPTFFFNDTITPREQYTKLLIEDRIGFTSTSFIQKDSLYDVGLFDERFSLIEDYPMWLKLTSAGIKLYFMPIVTVKHRRHADAVYNTTQKYLIKPSFLRNEELRKIYVYPHLNWLHRSNFFYQYWSSLILKFFFFNTSNKVTRTLKKVILQKINPFNWLINLK